MGRPPSIGTMGVENKFKWPYKCDFIPLKDKRKLMGFAMEVAVGFLFKNFTYTFGGQKYLQSSGGPIGACVTMAVARIVMQHWKDYYDEILKKSDIVELLSGLYVDDGRTFHRKLYMGERFCEKEKRIIVDNERRIEDEKEGIKREEITRREILRAMNQVSQDLEFTMELCEDFPDRKLPTLSFSIFAANGFLKTTYFEKSMRNQTLVMERSAMGIQQKMSIMSNELIRRMEN